MPIVFMALQTEPTFLPILGRTSTTRTFSMPVMSYYTKNRIKIGAISTEIDTVEHDIKQQRQMLIFYLTKRNMPYNI